ncbi:MAG: type I-C CRISPR-associated protein Cas7/Csd2 [Spirochaetes bacterium]|uniref:Type I-C CRISPR-associated protein Cas7/Csd2 n=1 Tax=Candidatus Ornithospirochaeta stercoripullorum TaxID=2840899 RepID=A0A9D9H6P0_9SPIO|nr:type I-C CRISPR-associated protein Cas7/Csd2 [Candidatus Ornithospirochaeta stercoripullorum]
MNPIDRRYDFTILLDVQNGNPNGDPDANNMPRIDPETGVGIITDVCIKRKIRNYVEMVKNGEPGYDIYIRQGAILNEQDNRALDDLKIKDLKKEIKEKKNDVDKSIRDFMCNTFYDIRTFGAVMTTFVKGALNSGQVRGPVQFCFAESIDPVVPRDITLTRIALSTAKDAEDKRNTMGSKSIIPYGLYRMDGFISANQAKLTGFSNDDLELLWDAIVNMFEDDHSAIRGKMAVRKLIVFEHSSVYGNAPSWQLFDAVSVKRKNGITVPRSFSDYDVIIDKEAIPGEVNCIERLG